MNKTININLGGFFFHIDEIAYQKLRRYLESISRSLSDDPQGKIEIIAKLFDKFLGICEKFIQKFLENFWDF